jgi:hypothetical protein
MQLKQSRLGAIRPAFNAMMVRRPAIEPDRRDTSGHAVMVCRVIDLNQNKRTGGAIRNTCLMCEWNG